MDVDLSGSSSSESDDDNNKKLIMLMLLRRRKQRRRRFHVHPLWLSRPEKGLNYIDIFIEFWKYILKFNVILMELKTEQ